MTILNEFSFSLKIFVLALGLFLVAFFVKGLFKKFFSYSKLKIAGGKTQ